MPDRSCRGIGGASLGGTSALQLGLAHPDRFGMVLAFSPVLNDPPLAAYLARAWQGLGQAWPVSLLIDLDDDAIGRADLAWLRARPAWPRGAGYRLLAAQTPGGRHMIASWATRAIPALTQLVDAACR